MPTSCDDLERAGHSSSGFYSIKGSAMIESVFCDFTKHPSDEGKYFYHFIGKTKFISIVVKRIWKMDWIRRRQIGARLFLRPEKKSFQQNWNSDSVRSGAGERGKRHGFAVGEIHGTATGNLFLLFHRNSGVSRKLFLFFFKAFFLLQWFDDCAPLDWREHPDFSTKSWFPPVYAQYETGGSSLGENFQSNTRSLPVWKLWHLHPFHWFHAGGGNCGGPLRFNFIGDTKHFRPFLLMSTRNFREGNFKGEGK